MLWRVPLLTGALMLSWPLVSPGALSGQERPGARLEPHVFEASSGDTVHAELGRFRVPLEHGSAGSDSIELAFVRFPSLASNPGPPVVYLAGGPGGSGIATARYSRFPLFMAFRKHGDVIAFDQRGTGMSEGPAPEECDLGVRYPAGRPLYAAHHRKLILEVARRCGEMWRREGVNLAAYNTRESADDVAALAAALGTEEIRLWGISYGTHLGLTVIRRHPELVERAILAGVEGPDHTVKLPSYWTDQMERLEEMISGDPALALEFPDLTALVDSVHDGLERDPAPVEFISADLRDTVPSLVSRYEVELATIDRLQDPETMVTVPYAYRRMARGDFSVVASSPPEVGGLEAMSEAMDAASGISEERLFRFLREDETHLLGGGDDLANAYMGAALGVPDLGETFRAPVRSEIPALFISGTLDGRTPVANAEQVLEGFPDGQHLIIENAGHSDDLFLSSPDIQEVMEAFLAERPLPTLRIRVEPPELEAGRLPPSLPGSYMDRVIGAYRRSEGDVWRVVRRGVVRSLDAGGSETGRRDELTIRVRGNGYPFAARPDTSFHIPYFAPGLEFRFPPDASGEGTRMQLVRNGGDTTRFAPVDWDEVGFISSGHWLVTGPFRSAADSPVCSVSFAPGEDARRGELDTADSYPGEDGERRWVEAEGDDGFVNFEETLGGAPPGAVGYAYLSILNPGDRQAQIRVGTDDDARIYLNGEEIHAFDGARDAWEEQDVVPVRLPEGRSQLLVKVCNRDSDWRFNLRVTDGDGSSLVRRGAEGRGTVRLIAH